MVLAVKLEDPAGTAKLIESFLSSYVEDSGLRGALVGLSGGLDSAVVATLCSHALGPERLSVIALPSPASDARDLEDARLVADGLGVALRIVEIGAIVDGLGHALGAGSAAALDDATRGNAAARARMMVLYALAAEEGRVVVGTGNKSELLTGYFTKYGDGGVDLLPIGDLYKTQVRLLARHLGAPERIVGKAPSAGLWAGQTDEGELRIAYESLDRILLGLEMKLPPERIAELAGVAQSEVHRIEAKRRATQHKRRTPLVPRIGARTVGMDWRSPVTERDG